jgi:site-specific recombinase XerD
MPRLSKPASNGPTLGDVKAMWGSSLHAANKAPKTIRTYLDAVGKLEAHVTSVRAVDKISQADHEAMQAALYAQGWKSSSVSTVYRSLRSFWKWAVAHPDLPVAKDPMDGMTAPKVDETTITFVTDEEMRRIIATTKSRSRHNYLGHRDEAIIRLLASTGARLSEIATLRLQDVDLAATYPSVRVMGKGRRERDLPLDEATAQALRVYLTRERPRHPSATTTDRVWLARAGEMTANGIAQMVAQRAEAAKVGVDAQGKVVRRVHPHELRHRFIAQALGAGLSEGDVMSLSGHRSRSMLDRYGRYTRAQRAHDAFRKASASGAIPKL